MITYTHRKAIVLAILGLSSSLVYAAPPRSQPFGARSVSLISSYGGGSGEDNGGGAYQLNAVSARVQSNMYDSGAGSARANLATGTLGAAASSQRNFDFAWIVNQSTAWIWDTVTITASGENLGIIPLQLEMDGLSSGLGKASFSGWVYDLDNDRYLVNYADVNVNKTVKFDSEIDTEFAPLRERHFMVGMGIGAMATINPGERGGDTAESDYMHTLHFRWNMPENFTFTSASGVFNPERIAAPVPEPATLAALGLGVLGFVRKRRKG